MSERLTADEIKMICVGLRDYGTAEAEELGLRIAAAGDIYIGAPEAAAILGAKGGAAKTEAKQDASRANGAKGGRPRKQPAETSGSMHKCVTHNLEHHCESVGSYSNIAPVLGEEFPVQSITQAEFDALPTEAPKQEIGKRWKKLFDDGKWYTATYKAASPGYIGVQWRRVEIT